ncbi:MAG: CoA-binding protein, partial [Rhodanobacter sp.]
MTTYNLDAFMKPASVALVGASRRSGSVGAVAADNLRAFPGRIFLVNHHMQLDTAAGVYPQVADLPETPGLAIVAVPAATVPAVITDLGKLGTRAAVVMSAGFGEASASAAGKTLEDEMLAAARATGMRILGPNCIGMLA